MRAESEFFGAERQVSRFELGNSLTRGRESERASSSAAASSLRGRAIRANLSAVSRRPYEASRRRCDCERYLSWMRYRHAWELEPPGQLLLKYA